MKKIVLTRGIPASGKSTWANEEAGRGALTITKDEIRQEMGITKDNWTNSKEKDVIDAERGMVQSWMKCNSPYIIVDNTHLGKNNKHITFYQSLAHDYGYEFSIKDFECSREEAISRDAKRPKSVGSDVIDKMIKISGKPVKEKSYPDNPQFAFDPKDKRKRAFIFDIDGTLAFMNGKRSPYDFQRVGVDDPNHYLINLLNLLQKNGNTIIVVSGRDGACEEETRNWLSDNGVVPDLFFMRANGDKSTPDTKVKKSIYKHAIEKDYHVMGVFDDRNKVVDMWRNELNLPTYQVWYGDF